MRFGQKDRIFVEKNDITKVGESLVFGMVGVFIITDDELDAIDRSLDDALLCFVRMPSEDTVVYGFVGICEPYVADWKDKCLANNIKKCGTCGQPLNI